MQIGKAGRIGRMTATMLLLMAGLTLPEVGASETTAIGTIDQGAIEASPSFQSANAQVAAFKSQLDGQFAQAIRGVTSPSEKQRIAQQFTQRFEAEQATVLGPLFRRGHLAIAEIAHAHHLAVVVDRRIVITGGVDLTPAVLKRLGDARPFADTGALPPSSVGYVDQQQIDALPDVRQSNARFSAAEQTIAHQAEIDIKSAQTAADRTRVVEQAQAAEKAKHQEILDPILDRVNTAIAKVGSQAGLTLVVDKRAIMVGGKDITGPVLAALR